MEAHLLELKQHISQLSDDELLEIVTTKSADYRDEALTFARAELTARGIAFEEPVAGEDAEDAGSAGNAVVSDPTMLPFLRTHGAVCPGCRGPLRYGTLVGEKEITIIFADNQEERFVRVSACSQCGQVAFMVDYETTVE